MRLRRKRDARVSDFTNAFICGECRGPIKHHPDKAILHCPRCNPAKAKSDELPDYLKYLEELEKKATPGPWDIYTDPKSDQKTLMASHPNQVGCSDLEDEVFYDICEFPNPDYNSLYGLGTSPELIAELRNALPRILSDFKQLQKDKAELIEALEKIKSHGCCVMHNDDSCPGCESREVLARVKGEKE